MQRRGDIPVREPDPRILAVALARAGEVLDRDVEGFEWRTIERLERWGSNVFRVQAARPGAEPVVAYYKALAHNLREPLFRYSQPVTHDAVERVARQTERLTERSRGEPVVASRVLAVDPEALTIVTLEVPGQPLSNKMLLPRRGVRSELTEVFRRIGRALYLVDQCTEPGEIDPITAQGLLSDLVAYRIQRFVRRWPRRRDREFLEHIDTLVTEIRTCDDFVFAHGDMRFGNVLVAGDAVGLIDLNCIPRPRGWDLGMITAHLRTASLRSGWGRRELEAALLDGYGDPEVTTWLGFRLAEIDRLAFNATRPGRPRHGTMVGRAQRQLERTFLTL
jgi:hypothetical protein